MIHYFFFGKKLSAAKTEEIIRKIDAGQGNNDHREENKKMRGLGTIINALAILVGGVLGILFKRFLKERYQDTIIKATGFSVVFLGAAGTLSKMLAIGSDGTLSTRGSMVMILSLALGALLGELIDLDAQFERFGEWLKHKTRSDGDNQFVSGFVAAPDGEVSEPWLSSVPFKMALRRSFHTGSKGNSGFYHRSHYGIVYGKGLCVLIYSGGGAARHHDCPCRGALRLYDGRSSEQSLTGG